MDASSPNSSKIAGASTDVLRRLLSIGGNRLELFAVEWQEERERILRSFMLGLAIAVFGMLGAACLTVAVAALLWPWSPAGALLGAALFHGLVALVVYTRLRALWRNWNAFNASVSQLRKDCECLQNPQG